MLKVTGVLRPLKQIGRCFGSSIKNQYSIKKTPYFGCNTIKSFPTNKLITNLVNCENIKN